MKSTTSLNEPGRLAALERYAVLDTPAEVDFDDFTQLASQICQTPIALISLLDERRQWFKSKVGLEVAETPRNVSFCQHTIQGPGLLEIPDALQDERFRDNPLVTGEPRIRFYAGALLTTPDGYNLGTLCVIDRTPRELTTEQRDGLNRLARQVMAQLELRRSREEFRQELAARLAAEGRLRRASDLLSAVGQLQAGYISKVKIDSTETFDALLKLILCFTDSEYGFAAEVLRDGQGQPYLKTHAITNIAWNEEMRAFYEKNKAAGLEFHNLKTLFGAALTTGETVIANAPDTDPRRGGLPPGHPPMKSFLGVPIKYGGELIAMVGVSNRPGGYDEKLVEEIEPLLSTYSTIIRGFQLAKQQRADQQRILALNGDLEARAGELAKAQQEKDRAERERLEALQEHSVGLERRVSERTVELERTRRQFQDLFEFAPDALVMMDESGRIKMINRLAEQMFGWTRVELVGQTVEILMPGPLQAGDLTKRNRFLKVAKARPMGSSKTNLLGRRKDGTEFPIEISYSPVQTAEGTLVAAAMRDISERKQLEQELARLSSHEQERLAHELHDHFGGYLAGIAFRFKALSETLERRAIPEAVTAQQLVLQVNAGIDQVRNFARLLAPVNLAAGGLAAGLSQLGKELETVFNIVCLVTVAPELPPLTQEQSVQLYRIAQEATRNAVQHGKARQITISIRCDPESLIQTVANDGQTWIPALDSSLGLGLRIMRHRADTLGATLTLKSNPSGHTEAICRLPLATTTRTKKSRA